jgi:transketolase
MFGNNIVQLREKALKIRELVITSLAEAGSGHIGGSLGLADVFAVLYFGIMNHDPRNPEMKNRDKLVLSIGHVAPVLYSSLALAGYFPVSELKTLRKINSRLQGHPSFATGIPGLETASGSLGQGLSITIGMAIADKLDKKDRERLRV